MALTGVDALSRVPESLVRRAAPHQPAPRPTSPAVPAPRPAEPAGVLWQTDLHGSTGDPLMDTMTFLNDITHAYPDAISFAPGRPYEGLFEPEELFGHMRRYMDHLRAQGASDADLKEALFQYGPTAGRIRELVADALRADEGVDVLARDIVVTVGCQEAMLLALRALFRDSGDALMVVSPCYVGIVGAARLLDITVRTVPEREDGLHVADVEDAVRRTRQAGLRPRALYVVPDHSNPSGNSLELPERKGLLDLAGREDFLILEDSPYRHVSPGPQVPLLKALDTERRVVHLGSFSKTAFPAARLGYVVADQEVRGLHGETRPLAGDLAKLKSMVTVNTPALSQAAVAGMLLSAAGSVSQLAAGPAGHYEAALRQTLDSLERHFGSPGQGASQVRWNRPRGGFFMTLHVPFDADEAALTRSAVDHGVIWTPMRYFHPEGGGLRSIRLSYSCLTLGDIDEGVARLARFVRSEITGRHD
ncbi:aminotransferase class I/II-fold pyridoxal phosphate-dependent enzyme [Streptomyces sp. DHE7-1]|nr:aminotransferase class I/II-fold pyridoxal phosphate-dependent enzyme [Streptomyces sp. DHE7-1]